MLDREIQAALPSMERFIRRFRAPYWCRMRLAIDDDDVHNDCRYAAICALQSFRLRYPAKAKTDEEVFFVRRAIANTFFGFIRKANTIKRCLDATGEGTIQAGNAPWMPAGLSLEDEYLDAEREEAVRRACAQVREIVGDEMFEDLLRNADGEHSVGVPRKESFRNYSRRQRSIRKARQQLPAASIDDVVGQFGGDMTTMEAEGRWPKDLNDLELARMGVFYKRVHDTKIDSLDRDHLLKKVVDVNTAVDPKTHKADPYPLPPCFADTAVYDPADAVCNGTAAEPCDFHGDCKAALGKDADVETELVQIKGRLADKAKEEATPPPAKKPEKAKEKAKPAEKAAAPTTGTIEATAPTSLALRQVFSDNDKRQEGKRLVIIVKLTDGDTRAVIFDAVKNTTSDVGAGSFFKDKSKGKGFSYVGVLDNDKAWNDALVGAGFKDPPKKAPPASTPLPPAPTPTPPPPKTTEPLKATIHPHAVADKKAKGSFIIATVESMHGRRFGTFLTTPKSYPGDGWIGGPRSVVDGAARWGTKAEAQAVADAIKKQPDGSAHNKKKRPVVVITLEEALADYDRADVGKLDKAAPAATKPARAAKPKKAGKLDDKKAPARNKAKARLEAPIAVSTRKGVLADGKRKVDPRTNKPWIRLPQGSAATLAQLAVGSRIQREYEGWIYGVKKVKDGVTSKRADGTERKRDGEWVLEWKENKTAGVREAVSSVRGSLGVITRFITKSNVWSAAKFFNVVPDALNPHKETFAPAKYKPEPVYAYGVAAKRGPRKAEKKRKPKKKASTKKAKKKGKG